MTFSVGWVSVYLRAPGRRVRSSWRSCSSMPSRRSAIPGGPAGAAGRGDEAESGWRGGAGAAGRVTDSANGDADRPVVRRKAASFGARSSARRAASETRSCSARKRSSRSFSWMLSGPCAARTVARASERSLSSELSADSGAVVSRVRQIWRQSRASSTRGASMEAKRIADTAVKTRRARPHDARVVRANIRASGQRSTGGVTCCSEGAGLAC